MFRTDDHASLLAKLNTFSRLRRLIKSWLKAGIMEGDMLTPSGPGHRKEDPASPLLANIAGACSGAKVL